MARVLDIEVILFDWGGTLAQVVRQDELLRRGAREAARVACDPAVNGAVEHLVERVLSLEKEAACHPELREADVSDALLAWSRAFAGRVNPDKLAAAVAVIGREWIGSLEPLPGAQEALRELRRQGYRMGLVSNCLLPPEYCRQEFERHGFGGLLDFHIFSSAVGYRKPSPKIYEAALREAFPKSKPRDPSRVLFVGDSPAFDIVAPAALGMKTALVTCYKGIWAPGDYERAKPDLRIDAVSELPALLGTPKQEPQVHGYNPQIHTDEHR